MTCGPKLSDPGAIAAFNAQVSKDAVPLVGVAASAAAASLLLGGSAAYDVGAGLLSGVGAAVRNFAASLYVTAGRAASGFTQLSLAEQGISIGGAGGAAIGLSPARAASDATAGLSRIERAAQIYNVVKGDKPFLVSRPLPLET